jgi:drug/metabolite transporter (DMT)-like permease
VTSKTAPSLRSSTPLLGILFGALGVVAFSFTLPMTSLALTSFPSLFLGAGRAVVAAAIAIVVLVLTRTKLPTGRQWLRLAVVALGVVVGFPFFTSFALQFVPSSHGAVMIGLLPAATAVAAVIRGRERPSRTFWVASLGGAAAVAVFAIVTNGALAGPSLGDLLLVGAVILAAMGYAEGGLLSREIGSWQTISWSLVVALPAMVPLALISVPAISPTVTPQAWLGFAYIAVVSMYLGFFAWYRGLAIGPMARISQIQLIQPVLTIAWSAIIFGELVSPVVWIAAAAVFLLAGIAVRARVKSLATL